MSGKIQLQFAEQGQGPAVVMLHGFPLCKDIWREVVRDLSRNYRVITPDLRGHGNSPASEGPYSMHEMAADVLALLDTLKVDKVVLMGHSMGGYVMLAAWDQQPQRFSALGLISSQAAADSEEARTRRFQLITRVENEGVRAVVDVMTPKLFSPGWKADDPLVVEIQQMMIRTSPQGIIGALRAMASRFDYMSRLAEIAMPMLIVTGVGDQVIPLAQADTMMRSPRRGHLSQIKGAGHLPMLENAPETCAAIRDFLKKVGFNA